MIPLKLSSIDQEHLQELYDASGIARDELPYTPEYDILCEGFQDRTFKNATPDQVYAALLKYTRSSTNSSKVTEAIQLTDDQRKLLKTMLVKHGSGGKLLPYSDAFNSAIKDFNAQASMSLSGLEFWRAVTGTGGAKRKPPTRAPKVKKEVEVEDDSDE